MTILPLRAAAPRLLLCTIAVIACTASDAHAQMTMGSFKGYLTPFVGTISGADLDSGRLAAGASVSVQEQSGWGAEVDFGRSTDVRSNNVHLGVTTYAVNASFIKPGGIIRPFGVGGVALMQLKNCCVDYGTDYGFSAGGGAVLALHDLIGVRADARYFFTPRDHAGLRNTDRFAFWRLTIGAALMWDISP
jgi:hypothetical protein